MEDVTWIVGFVARAVEHVWPAFLLSILFGVGVRALKLDGVIRSVLGRRVGVSILLATALGAFSPFCSCTVVPVVAGLLASGVPLAPVMSFWIASPTMDPEIFTLTVATLGWPLALARLGATLALSVGAGFLTWALARGGLLPAGVLRPGVAPAPRREPRAGPARAVLPVLAFSPAPLAGGALPVMAGAAAGGSCCTAPAAPPRPTGGAWSGAVERLREADPAAVLREVAEQSWKLGRWLLLAFVLEALITRYVPQTAIAGVLGGGNPFAIPLAALVGVPLYLNNAGALPIVSGLLAQGMSPGAAIAFLVAGPVTTVPAMTAVWGVVERRVFSLYLAIGLAGSVAAGWITQLLLG